MTNLTLNIDENLLRKARILALEQGTSVNALVRTFIESMVDESSRRADRAAKWSENLAQCTFHSTEPTPRMTRQEMYDSDPRMQRLMRIGQLPDAPSAANVAFATGEGDASSAAR